MTSTYTYQDYEKATDISSFIISAIALHKSSDAYKTALSADKYDAQMNETINDYVQYIYTSSGAKVEDFTASNNRIASNFFNRLNTQRVQYSLGNGVSFIQADETDVEVDATKEALGPNFDRTITEGAYFACIHGVSFVFWNLDHIHVFKLTEFVPLYDENDGSLRAGIRFWQLDNTKPLSVMFFHEDGYSEWRQDDNGMLKPVSDDGELATDLNEILHAYVTTTAYVPADDAVSIIGEENYSSLPIVPMWTSRLKQSTLIGMRSAIDAYDLIKSGFANDMQDCATIYWIVRNANGMSDNELAKFRDTLKLHHIAHVDGVDGSGVQPYTQEIPYAAREAFLTEIRNGIYEDFGALDVHTIAASSTNDHIDAAYQPMDENASDFEYWVGGCIVQLLKLIGIDDKPEFSRQRISNVSEQVSIIAQEAQWLDRQTILRKLPNVSPDEVAIIMEAVEAEEAERFSIAESQLSSAAGMVLGSSRSGTE